MKKPKPMDYEILCELMKNAKMADRKIAKKLGVSQATVTRRRAFLEKELIDGYTTIPRWEKLGYKIFAITFIKIKSVAASKEKYATVRKRGVEWLMSQPNIIMAGACRGIRMDSFNLSVHTNYSDYDEWLTNLRLEMGDLIEDVQTVLVNLAGKEILKPLHLKYLAEQEKTSKTNYSSPHS